MEIIEVQVPGDTLILEDTSNEITEVQVPGDTLILEDTSNEIVELIDGGFQGPSGIVKISIDAGNRVSLGSDAGIFVPELVGDPLAYYILAKS